MRHSDYNRLFRNIATSHRWIRHEEGVAKNQAFFRIIDTPENAMMAKIYLEEFLNKQSSIKRDTIMVLMNYQTGYDGEKDAWKKKEMTGVFFILQRAKKDFDDIEAVLDRTEQIGEEVLARVQHQVLPKVAEEGFTPEVPEEDEPCNLSFAPVDMGAGKIGPIGADWFGTFFYFTLSEQFNLFDISVATSEEIWL